VLEELLKEQVRGDPAIAGMLTTYKGKPAFFFQKSPIDADPGWKKPNYPRIDYNINNQYDPERKVSATLVLNTFCTNESPDMPEDIDERLIKLIGGTFYSQAACPSSASARPGDGTRDTVCAIWSRSDGFNFEMPLNVGGNTSPEVFGITTTFDLLEFPVQLTTDPDPIESLNAWTRECFPSMTVINLDCPPALWKPDDANPAIYWRFEGTATNDRQSYAVNWYSGQFAAHVITASVTERNRWTKAIIEQIQQEGEILLIDGSPMFAKKIVIRHNADPLREGQLVLTGAYGVLAQHRKERAQIPLNRAVLEQESRRKPNLRLEVKADGKEQPYPGHGHHYPAGYGVGVKHPHHRPGNGHTRG
jgi:hypothetical protein